MGTAVYCLGGSVRLEAWGVRSQDRDRFCVVDDVMMKCSEGTSGQAKRCSSTKKCIAALRNAAQRSSSGRSVGHLYLTVHGEFDIDDAVAAASVWNVVTESPNANTPFQSVSQLVILCRPPVPVTTVPSSCSIKHSASGRQIPMPTLRTS
ncbi:hypothetical protein CMUS01_00030 [Colletotrichum musicola]|uniref:Uncharacterized protein n=1 Tax=Colletotrichum musicola TaxID=2175873 RepID=A0A8H6NZD0_9PEZI|nr:hypothetical protein CMUS01_00030 [Colletotrichum musicola]